MEQRLLYHDSQQLFYRSPFGAVPISEKITLRISGFLLDKAAAVTIRLWRENQGEELIPMVPAASAGPEGTAWEQSFIPSHSPGLVWYYFVIKMGDRTCYYGNNEQRLGGVGQLTWEVSNSWQITVHEQEIHVPEWFLEGVMYQIFPDRFCNGLADHRVRHPKKNSFLYGHWSDDPVYVKDPATAGIMRWDFFGGNLEGIIEKLPYLKDLGISIIYLNPIFEAASNHRYDTGDFKRIEPMLGSENTYVKLCQKANEMGINIILDGVFSHTGSDSKYFNREGHYDTLGAYNSQQSPYYPWYRFKHYPDQYEAWWGIDNMPNVDEMEHSYRNFIMEDNDSVIRRWMKKGAKGWRLDVADELPTPFIRQLRRVLKETDPEGVLIGEVWEDASNKASYGERRSYLLGAELDSVMNYPFRETMLGFFLGKHSGQDVKNHLMSLYENYPRRYFYSCMNLIGSHDRERILTLLGNAPDATKMTLQNKINYRLSEDQLVLAKERLKVLIGFQMTFPGVPSIYYGDEAGLQGFSDPLNRRTYPWGKEEMDLLEWTKKMVHLRREHPIFSKGDWSMLQGGKDELVVLRTLEDHLAIVLVNRHQSEKVFVKTSLQVDSKLHLVNALTGDHIEVEKGWLEIELPPLSLAILMSRH